MDVFFYQLNITLRHLHPAIQRRLLIREDATLEEVHTTIQFAFGWTNSHMHEFTIDDRRIGMGGDIEMGFDGDPDVEDEQEIRLRDLQLSARKRFRYTYDFGDEWEHDITVEKRLSVVDAESVLKKAGISFTATSLARRVAFCLNGKRCGPMEDSGGPWGYAELIAILADPQHPEHEERKEWAEEFAYNAVGRKGFDPEQFDQLSIDRTLSRYVKRIKSV